MFAQLRYTPAPALFHGVVLLRISVTMQTTLQSAKCALGLVVHAVNTAPAVLVNQTQILRAQGGGFLRSRPNHLLGPALQFTDPDVLSESEWFAARTPYFGLAMNASCGILSMGLQNERDYISGAQLPSIAGTEGLTFLDGDGDRDQRVSFQSTLENLNAQMHRLYYHPEDCLAGNVTVNVTLDDLGNYGGGGPMIDKEGFSFTLI